MSPRKRFGQNFLIDRNLAEKLVAAADLTEWRGQVFIPWAGEGYIYNTGLIFGYVIGGMLLGLLAASVRKLFTKEP